MRRRPRIISIDPDVDPQCWRQALRDRFWRSGTLIKDDDRGRQVWRAPFDGQDLAIKARPLVGVLGRCRLRLGLTDLAKAHRAFGWLTDAGFLTPKPVLHAEIGGLEILITPWLDAETVLHRWASADAEHRRALARATGELVGRLSCAGMFNRDSKPSNLIWLDPDIAWLDIGGVRRVAPAEPMHLARMIAALGFEPAGTGHAPNAAEIFIATRAAITNARAQTQRHDTIDKLRTIIRTHSDPTPKNDPLAPMPTSR